MVYDVSTVKERIAKTNYSVGDTAYLSGYAEDGKLCKVMILGIDVPSTFSNNSECVYLVRKIDFDNARTNLNDPLTYTPIINMDDPLMFIEEYNLIEADEAERLIKTFEEYYDERNVSRKKENNIIRKNGVLTEPQETGF